MPEALRIVDLDEYDPTGDEILSWREFMTAPDQLRWDYDPSWASEQVSDEDEIASFRQWRLERRGSNHPLWALADGVVAGMIGINRGQGARAHCGELGIGVRMELTRRGIGRLLLVSALAKARRLGLRRLEADCFADNAASVALLRSCGFAEEGLRPAAICRDGQLRDIRLFGLLL